MWKQALLLSLLAACKKSPPETGAAGSAAPPAALEVVPVVSKQLAATVRLPAEVAPDEAVAIYPRVQAFVEDIAVDRGSVVKKGDLLARLSAPELAAQRAEAQSKVTAAKSTYDRLKSASQTPGAIAGHDLEVAKASLDAESSRVDALRTLEAYLFVRAPFDGVITERSAHPGALVGPPSGTTSTPLLRIEKIDQVRVTVAVPEANVGAIADGGPVDFTVSTWPGETFSGKVSHVSHVIDSKTRTMAVELVAANANKKLVPGAYAEVVWPVHRDAATLFVPPTAIVQTTERTFVDRVRDGKVEQVTVQRGSPMGELVEVFGPLAAGDQVLKRGSEVLATGASVQTKPAK